MIRETAEEAGLRVIPESIREYGLVRRTQKSDEHENEIFAQDNYYYLCRAEAAAAQQKLDDYEAAERFTLEWVEPSAAIETNRRPGHGVTDPGQLEREARVLEQLLREGFFEPKLDLTALSSRFFVRRLLSEDVDAVYRLASRNTLYYRYHKPFVTPEGILEGMAALPPGVSAQNKFYIGFFDGEELTALMDLVLGYPSPDTAYIGLFMTKPEMQGRGLGSRIISDCADRLRLHGFVKLRLAVDKGNPQSAGFWTKNGFSLTGEAYPNGDSAYLPMERPL